MSIVFKKGIFAMPSIIERSILKLAEFLGTQANDGEKFGAIYERMLQKCPRLHSDEEHKALADKFIKDFIKEFDAHELRVWFEVNAPMTFGDESLEMKYFNLLKIHDTFVNKWLQDNNLTLRVDVYLFGNRVRDSYREAGVSFAERYGESSTQLWGIIKTIRDSGYDEDLILSLEPHIKKLLSFSGGWYYSNQELTQENLKKIYLILSEALHKNDGFKGHQMFQNYDGYGNVICDITGEILPEY